MTNNPFESNRKGLDEFLDKVKYWLHIEDPSTIWTMAAAKISHKLQGDPVWIMIIGPSSDGKSEMLRMFTQPGELTVDDLTSHTFVSGYTSKKTDHLPQFAEKLANRIWYIYDLSIMLSKPADERSVILSQLRMIYDGKLEKNFGNKLSLNIATPNNTLICGSTPAIDSTILEDQLLGTRFLTWRTHTGDRFNIMRKIDDNEDNFFAMRPALKIIVENLMENITILDYKMNELENQNIQLLANQTTLLRTSVSLDRNKELRDIAYPEAPGRLYRQMKKLYKSYRILGLTEEEALNCIRKMCIDCILPTRLQILRWLVENNHNGGKHTTTEVSVACQMGKGATKGHLSSLMGIGVVQYNNYWDQVIHREVDQWTVLNSDKWNLLLGLKNQEQKTIESDVWVNVDVSDGKCAGCGLDIARVWKLGGDYYCENCHKEY